MRRPPCFGTAGVFCVAGFSGAADSRLGNFHVLCPCVPGICTGGLPVEVCAVWRDEVGVGGRAHTLLGDTVTVLACVVRPHVQLGGRCRMWCRDVYSKSQCGPGRGEGACGKHEAHRVVLLSCRAGVARLACRQVDKVRANYCSRQCKLSAGGDPRLQ